VRTSFNSDSADAKCSDSADALVKNRHSNGLLKISRDSTVTGQYETSIWALWKPTMSHSFF